MSEKPTYEELEQRVKELSAALSERDKLIDHLPDYVMMMDLNYHIIWVNKTAADALGKPPEEMTGKCCHEIWHNRNTPCENCPATVSMKTGRFHESEIIMANGGIHHIRGYPAYDENGEMIGAVEYSIDISKWKQTEAALQESEKFFKTVIHRSPLGIGIVNSEGDMTECNEALCNLIGYEREELLQLNFSDFTHPDDLEAEQALIRKMWDGATTSYQMEKRYIHKNQNIIWVNVTASVIIEDGIMQLGFAFVEDITERRQMEQTLKESERSYRMLAANLPDTDVYLFDQAMRFVIAEGALMKRWGGTPEYFEGKKLTELPDHERQEFFLSTYQRAFQGKHVKTEFVWSESYYSHQVIPLRTEDREKIVGGIAMTQDISEQKQTEIALQNALAEKEVLLREIHHRVKNNMQIIISMLRMHARKTDHPVLRNIFADCRDRIEAMSLIHESLYQSEDLTGINLREYLRKLCNNLARIHNAAGKRVTLQAELCDILLDMDQGISVGMVIAELVSNAFKHAFSDDADGDVTVYLDFLEGETVRIMVSDTGKGLPDDFDIRNPSSLGMRLVWGTVTRELGGSIEAASDRGAKFIIRFSCEEGEARKS